MSSELALPPRTSAAQLSSGALAAVTAGMPEATRRAYREDVERFVQWCRDSGRGGLPANGAALTEYATHLAYGCHWSPVSIERARWAILKWHSIAELPQPSTDGLVSVLKGYREHLATAKSPKAKPRKATAASKDAIAAMLGKLDRSTAAGRRDAAIVLLGFGVGARRSELAALDIGDLDFQERGVQVTVYRKKTRKMDDPVIHYRPSPALCPVRAAEAWVATLAASGRTTGPLFVRISRHGQLANPIVRAGVPIGNDDGRMTGQAVAEVVRRCAIRAGLSGRWTGHSLRRGLATAMRQAGAERRDIERQGGWSADSRAVAGYIDDADRWLLDVLEGVL